MITENSMMSLQRNDIDVVKIPKNIPIMDVEDYDLFDDKDKEKYITDLERYVRSSYEYKAMVQYLREYMNMSRCAFMPYVSNETSRKIRIELHHSPFTLRDICVTIAKKRLVNNEIMTLEAVAYEVMFVHYSLMVGLIPLSETVHQLVHSQYIFVPTDRVYGYYRNFVEAYYDYIEPELLDRLDELEKLTLEGTYNNIYKEVLEKKYIAIDMEGNNQFEQLHNLQEMLKERMSQLRTDTEVPNKEFVNSTLINQQNIK